MLEKDRFNEGLSKLNITLDAKQKEQFQKFYEMLVEWNKVMNLTGITEYEEVVEKHFLDSLAMVQVQDPMKVSSLIDVGTGAGFPGIPLKIAYPHMKVVLLDSLNKRIKFLNEVIKELDLKDIATIHGRAEELGRDGFYREKFDCCVSRAVAKLSVLSEYCMPLVKENGYFIPYKSGKIEEEMEQSKKAISILGGKIEDVYRFVIPDTDLERSLVCIQKKKPTPKKYPRAAGKPLKEPIE